MGRVESQIDNGGHVGRQHPAQEQRRRAEWLSRLQVSDNGQQSDTEAAREEQDLERRRSSANCAVVPKDALRHQLQTNGQAVRHGIIRPDPTLLLHLDGPKVEQQGGVADRVRIEQRIDEADVEATLLH